MKEKFETISIVVLCVIGFLLFIGVSSSSDSTETPKEEVQQEEVKNTYEEITATELFKQYEENSVRADSVFEGKTYLITGEVFDIGTELLGSNYVTLKVTDNPYQITSVQCLFKRSEEDKVISLNKGDKVEIIGRIDGLSMNVIVRDCILNN